ncbi:hypothetical protein AGMMS50229_00300 [Campylobacterota bacterium]|nr:hypothetical protein AGMMS50229_00300 [Campylobacterota bacterium]
MDFEPLSLKHKPLIDAAYLHSARASADSTFVNLWLWRFAREITVATHGDLVLIREQIEGKTPQFLMPFGSGVLRGAVDWLIAKTQGEGYPLGFKALSQTDKTTLETAYPDKFVFVHTDAHDDYLYDCSLMISLAGRNLHPKKNFVNRFEAIYGINYERLSRENLAESIEFIDRWFERAPYNAEAEHKGVVELLSDFERFACSYGLLRAEGAIAGLTVGEALTEDSVVIHIEKADGTNYPGSYQTINQVHLAREYSNMKIVNREEDLGLEGLRKAKHSYHPIGFCKKYEATLR